jgi:hypothetical protein
MAAYNLADLYSPDEFARSRLNNKLTPGAVQWLVHERLRNGLHEAGGTVKLGRRVYIHEPGFTLWLQQRNSK